MPIGLVLWSSIHVNNSRQFVIPCYVVTVEKRQTLHSLASKYEAGRQWKSVSVACNIDYAAIY